MPMEFVHLVQNFHNIFANCGEAASLLPYNAEFEVLDSSIWSKVPESVLYYVFSKLPLKSHIRVRSLSKLWMSTNFLSAQEEKSGRFAVIKGGKFCDDQEVWIFDTPAQEWCKFRLCNFPPPLKFSGPFAAAGGLLCYIAETSGTLRAMVGNPLTQTWRLLPKNLVLNESPTLTHMAVTKGDQYSITFVGLCDDTGEILIEVYDSLSNTWRSTVTPPQLSSYYNFFKGDEYLGLATIDTRSKQITRLMYPSALKESSFLDRYEDKCWILESKGSLFMCSNAPRKEGLWQRLETQWERVCPYPKVLQKYASTALFLSDQYMMLVGSDPHCFPPQFEDVDPHKIVLYDKVTRQWSVLPCISESFGTVDELVRGLMFEPSECFFRVPRLKIIVSISQSKQIMELE